SLQILKNVDALRSHGCDVKLLAPRRKNEFVTKTRVEVSFHLRNELEVIWLPSISLLHLTEKRFQWPFFLLMNYTFCKSAIRHIQNDRTSKWKLIFIRDITLLDILFRLTGFRNYSVIFEMHNVPNQERLDRE